MRRRRPSRHLRRRGLAALATAGLASGALVAVVAGTPAGAVAPTADCAQPADVAEVADGDVVEGLTVVEGTTPTGFTGEVLGTLENGIAPGVDMIMMDLDMPAFAQTGGVWSGMSGSPVYAEDGDLIGAVAYGLSYGPSPIAGITPFSEMDDYLAGDAPARKVRLDGADARTVSREARISQGAAARGFTQLPVPLGVNGLSPRRLDQAREAGPKRLFRETYVAGRAGAAEAGEDTIVAGGNLATSAAYGDISLTGVGTATSVCGDRVVGFGHPMAFLGSTTQGLHPADALYVQPDSLGAPFKVANVAPPVGTITDDRTAGITGTFGAVPSGVAVSSDVVYGARSREGDTSVYVPRFLPDVSLYQVIAMHDRVVDGPVDGSELFSWTVEGSQGDEDFELTLTDRWTGRELGFQTAFSIAESLYQIQSYDDVTIDAVSTSSDVTDDDRVHTLSGIDQFRDGRWVRVTAKAPARGTAGKPLRLRARLGGSAGARTVALGPITLPRNAPGRLELVAQGGDGMWSSAFGRTLDAYAGSLASQLRHDQVRVQVGTRDKVDRGFGGDDGEIIFFGREGRRPSFVRTRTTAPFGHVVGGTRNLTVRVR